MEYLKLFFLNDVCYKNTNNNITFNHRALTMNRINFSLCLRLFTICFLLSSATNLFGFGQPNFTAKVTYLYGFKKGNPGHLGGGLTGEYSLNKYWAFDLGFNYYNKSIYSTRTNAVAIIPNINPRTIGMEVRDETSVYIFYTGVKKYFIGQQYTFKVDEKSFGVYGIARIGVISMGMKSKVIQDSPVQSGSYHIPVTDNDLNAFTDLNLFAGIGVDKQFGPIYLYYNLVFGKKVVSVSNTGGLVKLPVVLTSNFGIRIPFGELD